MGYEPVEMHTAATEKLQNALSTYAGVTGDPTEAEYHGYLSVVPWCRASGSGLQRDPGVVHQRHARDDELPRRGTLGRPFISWAMATEAKFPERRMRMDDRVSGYNLPCGRPESDMRTDHPGQEDLVTAAAISIASSDESTIG